VPGGAGALYGLASEIRIRAETKAGGAGMRIGEEIAKVPKATGGDRKSKFPRRGNLKSGRQGAEGDRKSKLPYRVNLIPGLHFPRRGKAVARPTKILTLRGKNKSDHQGAEGKQSGRLNFPRPRCYRHHPHLAHCSLASDLQPDRRVHRPAAQRHDAVQDRVRRTKDAGSQSDRGADGV
jgi:hypothetical protein